MRVLRGHRWGPVKEALFQYKMVLLLAGVIIGMFAAGEILSPGYGSPHHMKNILRTASFLGFCAIGQTLVILTGGIDLTVGALISMGQIYSCLFINGYNGNTWWALLLVMALGILFGLINGVGISFLKISPLVMTMATASLVNGVMLISIDGAPRGIASPLLEKIGAGWTLGLPTMVWMWIVVTVLTLVFLHCSVLGRKIYHVGMNPEAAKFSGIRTRGVRTLVYAVSGMLSALTGALLAGNTSRAFLNSGGEYTMWSITAVVIGGTSMIGGAGGYLGTAAGAVIIILLEGILTVLKMPEAARKIANGVIVLVMIMIYYRKKNNR